MRELVAFLGVAVLVIVTPGPDTAVLIRGTLMGGRRAGVMTALGIVSGQVCWTVAASAGVTALLIASEPAFLVVRYAGGAYLVYLGVAALAAAVRGIDAHSDQRAAPPKLARSTAYRQGLLSDLSSPKMVAFFTSLLPQFGTAGGRPSFWPMLAFGLLFCSLALLWLVLYATVLARVAGAPRWASVRRMVEAVTGAVLVALGLRLATEPRPG